MMKGPVLLRAAIGSLMIVAPLLSSLAVEPSTTGEDSSLTHGLDLQPGAYAVVDFAASWCDPCYQALPRLQDLAEHHTRFEFRVVCIDKESADCDRMVAALDLKLPVVWDVDHQIVSRFSPPGFPATYVLDRRGQILYQHQGTGKRVWEELAQLLDRLDQQAAQGSDLGQDATMP